MKINKILILHAVILATLLLTACANTEDQTTEEQEHDKILLEYKPNDQIYLIVRGYNENKDASQSQKIITSNYDAVYNGITNKEISYTHWIRLDFDPPREVQIKNNRLIFTGFVYTGTHNEQEFPFLADEFYVENGKLWHASIIVFKQSNIGKEILLSLKSKMLKYKNRDHKNVREDEMQDMEGMPDDLLVLAICGDKEAIQLLKNRDAYNKYFNIELDGAFGEVHSAAEGAYDTFEYLRNQGGSIKEVITLDNASTSNSPVQ
jgi:hypothetical protein